MSTFRVWAPAAEDAVAIEIDGERHPLAAVPPPESGGDEGWWSADLDPSLTADGVCYRIVVDGDALADPWSQHQPEGVFGPSAFVDHSAFAWSQDEGRWLGLTTRDPLLYELHVGSFSEAGDFAGAAEHLDHLAHLGVDAVELLPVAEFPGDHNWGYDGVFLSAPHHAYGGPDGLKSFVDACHRKGMAVVLDVVFNHLGPLGNMTSRFGPYVSDRHHTPWGAAMNVDGPGSGPVRQWFLQTARMWLEDYRIDGLRLDAVHAIVDTSAVHLLEELADIAIDVTQRTGRRRFLIAESDLNDPRLVASQARGGYGLDAQWNDDYHHAIHALLTGERDSYYADFGTLGTLAAVLRKGWLFDGRWSSARGRRHGRPIAGWGVDGHSFVVCAQNHDQVGNRAKGDRLAESLSPGRLRIAAALVLLGPQTPMLFMGEEWGASTPFPFFTDHPDPDLARAVREGRVSEFAGFGWAPEDIPDPQDPETFRSAKLRWDEVATAGHADLLRWHQELVRIRRSYPELSDGSIGAVTVDVDESAGLFAMTRGRVSLVCNVGKSPVPVTLSSNGSVVLAYPHPAQTTSVGSVTLPPDGVVVAVAR